jgi:hypothetical protein
MLRTVISFALLLLLLISSPASALYIKTGDNIVISEDTIIDDNLFVSGDDVVVSGKVNGDLIAFGGDIILNGEVNGNIIVAGGNVTVSGTARNVFVAGGDVSIAGVIKNDLFAGCGQLYIDKNSRIGKDAFLGCGDAKIAGKIYRDLGVAAGNLMIAPGALIKGKLAYSVDTYDLSKEAKVMGTITSYARPNYRQQAAQFMAGVALVSKIVSFLAIFIIGVLAIIFLPNQVKLVSARMVNRFWKSLVWGIISLLVIPIIALLLCITLVGIPLGAILVALYIFGIYVAGIFISVVIGKAIFDRIGMKGISLIWSLFLGLIILTLLGLIPLLGWLIKLVLFLWAFGALVATRFTTYKLARENKIL